MLSIAIFFSPCAFSQTSNEAADNQVLQENLFAIDKRIGDLRTQLAEMQQEMKTLQEQLGVSAVPAASSVAEVTVIAASSVPLIAEKTLIAQPDLASEKNTKSRLPNIALFTLIIAGLLILAAFIFYRKRKNKSARGIFDELDEAPKPAVIVPAKIAEPQSLASTEQAAQATDEFTEVNSMIEEAELYAIHGYADKAIEILNDLILEHPAKVEAWLLLLSIYRNPNTAQQFESIAGQFLNTMGMHSAWKGIREAGRSIDPDKPLYFDADSFAIPASALDLLPKHRLIGDILVSMNAISVRDLEISLVHFDHLRDGRLGGFLVARGLIQQSQLDDALQQQSAWQTEQPSQPEEVQGNAYKPRSISEVLIQMGAITEHDLEHILISFNPKQHGHLGTHLVATGIITEKQLHTALLQQLVNPTVATPVNASDEKNPQEDYIPWDFSERASRQLK